MGRASLNLLSKNELNHIHNSALEILENPGLVILSKRALEILDKAGANVDYKRKSVTIPSHIVKEALKKAPKTIRYCARNPKHDITLEKKKRTSRQMDAAFLKKTLKQANGEARRKKILLNGQD